MRHSRRLGVLLPLLFVSLAAVARMVLPGQGEELLIQRQYREAAAALQAALPTTPPGELDRALLLLGQAQLLAGEGGAATATLSRLLTEQAGSALVPAARFLLARAHETLGDRKAAAAIWQAEIERLCGAGRKVEVAQVYLGLAEKARLQDPPDHARVVTFSDLAVDLGLDTKTAARVRLQAAEAVLAQGGYPAAIERLTPLVAELPVDGGRLPAMLALGRARRLGGDAGRARAVLRDLIALAPGDAAAAAGDAAYEIALSFGVPAPTAAMLDRAVGALAELRQRWPAHRMAKLAPLLAAQCHASCGRGDAALRELQLFLTTADGSGADAIAAARAMVGDVLASQGKFEAAIAAWREYLGQHPAHGEWERVQRAIVDGEWRLCTDAIAAGKAEFDRARERLGAFARSWPLDPRNPEAMYLLGEMLRREQKYDAAGEAFARTVAKYPGHDQASRAQYAIGEIFERDTFDHERALLAYRAVTFGPLQMMAQMRIAALVQKHLHVRTERVFGTAEVPAIVVTSRNIESLRVRVFRLDLEDYFRATQQTGDVARLDIEVITPDTVFDSAVPDYTRYRETERRIALPGRAPGAYVVKVDDQELEATTLVLVSDLALIAKSSRHEFLVGAIDTAKDEPAAGARVVLSDGQKVVAEGTTDRDGVWRYRGNELQNRDDLRVLAVDARGSGATSLDLSGMGYSAGLVPKGYLFADRPLYAPGQRVHWKGVVREVDGGRYRLPAAAGYRLLVSAPSGRLVLQRDLQFTAFGTFASELDLPADAELGDWRIAVDCPGRAEIAFATAFSVGRYERPRLQLAFALAQAVVLRGEPIAGTVTATWFHGEPAAGRAIVVRMALPDGGVVERTGVTDAMGALAIELPTSEFAEEAMAIVSAALPIENVVADVQVPVVTTEFTQSVRTQRDVYLQGEPFEITARLADRVGKPLVHTLVATLARLTTTDGIVVETEVEQRELTTGADGSVRASFRGDRGGRHRVRIAATDRFGNVVQAATEVTISAADDEVRVRLLAERQTWQVGETAAVRLVNRAGARLALLTWQGDGILACEMRRLPAGEQALQVPLLPEHAPNFALAVAMVDGNRLHTAECEFTVQRDLRVQVEVPAEARPGAEVEVVVRTTDPQGRPMRAEVALAMVDAALLALRGDGAPPIGEHFWGTRRETAFRTLSSCTWSYVAPSRPVDRALLAEERRRLVPAASDPGVSGGLPALVAAPPQSDSSRRELADQHFGAADGARFFGGGPVGGTAGAPGQAVDQLRQRDEAEGLAQVAYRALDRAGHAVGLAFLHEVTDKGVIPASDEPRVDFRETGAWLSSVTTGDDGVAKVAIVLPGSTTGWRLLARAVTADTWVGEGRASLRTHQPLQVDYRGPSFLTEGDATVLGAAVHDLGVGPQPVQTALQRSFAGATATDTAELVLPARGEATAGFPFTATAAGLLELELRVAAGNERDAVRRSVPVLPFGIEVVAGDSGRTTDRALRTISLPAGREYAAMRMFVELGPDPGRDLVRAALGQGYVTWSCRQGGDTALARASRGLAAVAVLAYLERGGLLSKLDGDQLNGQIAAMLQSLVQSQLADGGHAFVGSTVDMRTTCQVVRFFAACRRRGLPTVDVPLDKALEQLLQLLRTASGDVRADLLWALADGGRARFEALNSLHRARAGLAAEALARLALAWQAAGRPELAAEVVESVRGAVTVPALAKLPAETVALLARAVLQAAPRDALGVAAVEQLASLRRGAGWDTPGATAAAVTALATVRGGGAGAPRATEVSVDVNGQRLAVTPQQAQGLGTAIEVPTAWLRPGNNEVAIAVQGGGEAFWTITLVGSQRGFATGDRNDGLARVERSYLAAPRRHGERTLDAGFGVVTGGGYRAFENRIRQLGEGESGRVRVDFHVRRDDDRLRMAPLVLEEPLPAGCSVPRSSIGGNFDAVDVQPDRLLFWFRDGVTSGRVEYEVQARFAGRYRVLPSHLHGALRPELAAFGAVGELTVHAAGQGERDEYRLTPDELHAIGCAEFDDGMRCTGAERREHLARADEHLQRLVAEWQQHEYRLRDDIWRDVARRLLFLAIERGDAPAVVRWFEAVKERYPELVIGFEQIVAVGRCYIELGEFESALLVFRATAEAGFVKEAAVATTLEGLGEYKAGVAFLERLLTTWPDLPTMRVARYSIGQRLAAAAAAIDPAAVVDERRGSAIELRRRAVATFREFLVRHPEDPLAEEVSFAWVTTLLEGRELGAALQVAAAALQRYPNSPFQDELLYAQGFAHCARGEHDAAFALLERVATGQFPTDRGGVGDSESKWHAVYLQGQIWHARGEPEQAVQAYDRVQDRFLDAGEAIDFFRQRLLAVPEVTTFAGDAPAVLDLSWRNVATVAVQVFQVDLMRLYLQQRSLDDIRDIQLHGIEPLLAFDVTLGEGRDYATRSRAVPLALPGLGAYLCVVRGGDRTVSGLVLKSDLRLDVQEQFDVGRIRVNGKRGDAVVAGAHVKVVGSGGGDFQSGETDLRGVFAADQLVGRATVIAQKDGQFAFFRGEGVHQPAVFRPAAETLLLQEPLDPALQDKRKNARSFDGLEQNYLRNNVNRARQVDWLQKEVLEKQQRGVEVQKTR